MLILMAHVYNLFISETVAAINESKLQCHQFVFAFSDYTQKSLTILNLKKEYEKSKKKMVLNHMPIRTCLMNVIL